jgi:hypothetical protein
MQAGLRTGSAIYTDLTGGPKVIPTVFCKLNKGPDLGSFLGALTL